MHRNVSCAMRRGAAPSSGPDNNNHGSGDHFRVLVVEDDRDSALTLVALLREESFDAKSVYTFQDAVNTIDKFEPDAVLIDIGLPDRSGYELARKIRQRFGDKRRYLVAVTAWNKSSDKILAQLAGFNEHVGKPYDPARLLALLRSAREADRSDE